MKTIILSICFLFFTSYSISAQWSYQSSGTIEVLRSIDFISESTGWIVGDNGTLLFTSNNGTNWNPQKINSSELLFGVKFVNAHTGWIVGDFGECFKTTNGGTIWDSQYVGNSNRLKSIFFIDSLTGWIGADSGTILNTNDGGLNWISQKLPTNSVLNSIYFINADTGWIAYGGGISKTTNGGLNWIAKSIISRNWRSIFFINELTGWVVGGTTSKLKSTDGGENWFSPASLEEIENEDSPPPSVTSVYFINENTGWFTVYHVFRGTVAKTTNGGLNWVLDFSTPRQHGLLSTFFYDSSNGWAVGAYGTIIKYTSGIWTHIPENTNLPEKFLLYQNYPNPFNPVTMINYQLPVNNYVKLSIYDMLGRELSVLVNEKQNAGTYEIEWDASNYPSGVYFYKIITDGFSETKKMILQK